MAVVPPEWRKAIAFESRGSDSELRSLADGISPAAVPRSAKVTEKFVWVAANGRTGSLRRRRYRATTGSGARSNLARCVRERFMVRQSSTPLHELTPSAAPLLTREAIAGLATFWAAQC